MLLHRANENIKDTQLPWLRVQGPAAATIASMKRIGWTRSSLNTWSLPCGARFDLGMYGPREVEKLAERHMQQWTWQRAASHRPSYNEITTTPLLAPIKALLNVKDTDVWGPSHKGWLRSLCADSWWAPRSVFPLCGDSFSQWHALWHCAALDVFRREYTFPEGLQDCAWNGERSMVFHNALINNPGHQFPAPLLELEPVWTLAPGEDALFRGEAFGDGSGKNGEFVETRRCGWAVASSVSMFACVAAAREGDVAAGVLAYGVLPGLVQEVPLAELYALLFCLRHAIPDDQGVFVFYTDCEWVQSSLMRGQAHCTGASHLGAALWRMVFDSVDDVLGSPSCLHIVKVKAHTSLAACNGCIELIYRRGGNAIADRAAKEGAKGHPTCDATLENVKASSALVKELCLFMGKAAVWRWKHYGKDILFGEHVTQSDTRIGVPRKTLIHHRACLDPSLRWRCVTCLSSAESLAVLRRSPCLEGRAELTRTHKLDVAGDLVFCFKCGCYSGKRCRGLRMECTGPPPGTRATSLDRLMNEHHPTGNFLIGNPRKCLMSEKKGNGCNL